MSDTSISMVINYESVNSDRRPSNQNNLALPPVVLSQGPSAAFFSYAALTMAWELCSYQYVAKRSLSSTSTRERAEKV